MSSSIMKDLPVYIIIGGMLAFFAFIIIKANMPEKKDTKEEVKKENKQ